MAIPLGLDASIWYDADSPVAATDDGDGTYSLSVASNKSAFTELDVVTDVTMNLSKSEADITNRSTGGWRAMRGTLKAGELTFDMMWDTANADFQVIFDAYLNNTTIAFAALDGDFSSGDQGLYAEFDILGWEINQALEEAQRVSVTAKITIGDTVSPVWVDIVA